MKLLLLLFIIFISNLALADDNVIVVAKSGGDFSDIASAMDSITNASESNKYVVSVGPGVYYLHGGQIVVKPYVKLVGSGVDYTVIQSSVSSSRSKCGVVVLDSNAIVSNLTVKQSSKNSQDANRKCGIESIYSEGIWLTQIVNVRIKVYNNAQRSIGIYHESSAKSIIENVDVYVVNTNRDAEGDVSIGVLLDNTSLKVIDSDIYASSNVYSPIGRSIGIYVDFLSDIEIFDSTVRGRDVGVYSRESNLDVKGSQLTGPAGAVLSVFTDYTQSFYAEFYNTVFIGDVYLPNERDRVINSVIYQNPNVGDEDVSVLDNASVRQCHNFVDVNFDLIDC